MSGQIPLHKSLPQLLGTTAASAYGLYLSYQNITRLHAYEAQSEKAAEWSNTAARRLHKTRTTQASGTVTLLISFLTSTALVFLPSTRTTSFLPAAALLNTLTLVFARTHMARFWNSTNQTRIPFAQKFNDAVKGSERVVAVLGALAVGWALDAGLWWALRGSGEGADAGALGTLAWWVVWAGGLFARGTIVGYGGI